jgi:hypothetical protein
MTGRVKGHEAIMRFLVTGRAGHLGEAFVRTYQAESKAGR